jgi:pilus assembly protein CpaC
MLGKVKKISLYAFAAMALCLTSYEAFAEGMTIPAGRSTLVNVASDMTEVIVANPNIADAYVHGKRSVSIIGKAIGTTTVRVLGEDGQLRNITVNVGYDLPAIRKALKEFMPNEQVGVEMLNTNIALTGSVGSAIAAERAVKIVSEFIAPTTAPQSAAAGGQAVVAEAPVMNLLEVTTGQQVMLRVRVGEIERRALKNIGVNLQAVSQNGSSLINVGTGAGTELLNAAGQRTLGVFGDLGDDVQGAIGGLFTNSNGDGISAILTALERDNLFKVLAEPNLVALSGEEAEFLAGGEFPIPVPQGFGGGNGNANVTIQYKPFGVSVKFTPFVLSENRIRVAVEPEVSEINNDAALELSGFVVPSLTTRRAQTVVELSPGESFMIAGLIQDQMVSNINSMPGIKEIPILGALFSSVSYQRKETELVLAVTPHLVDPVVSNDIKLPTDDFRPASMMEMFFYGAMGSLHGDVDKLSQTPTIEGPIGFMVD